jgi:CelD/BcsL family acetyltransferase involved in cellulose biosynthesis
VNAPNTLLCKRLNRDQLPDIAPEWADLAERALTRNVFMRPEFVLPSLAQIDLDISIQALAVFEGKRLMGLLLLRRGALMRAHPLPLPIAIVHRFAPLSTPLIAAERPVETWSVILDHLRKEGHSALLLTFLEESAVSEALDTALSQRGLKRSIVVQHERAALLPDAGGLASGLSRKSSKNLARLTRRLETTMPLAITISRTGTEASAALARYFALEAAGWKGRAGTALAQSSEDRAFFEALIHELAESGSAMVVELHAGEMLAASALVLRHGDRAYFHKTTYNEDLAQFSPGVMLAQRLTSALADEGIVESADSVSSANHPMINRIWRGRLLITHALVPTGASRIGFYLRLFQERERERAIFLLKTLRDRIKGEPH